MKLFETPTTPRVFESWIAPLIGLTIVNVANFLVTSVLIAPLLSVCLMAILAFRLQTKVLMFWFVICSLNVIFALWQASAVSGQVDHATILVRSTGFLVTGLLAIALNRNRRSSLENHRSLLEMMGQFPVAVVVSDNSGTIIYANQLAAELLNKPLSNIIGLSFFSLFLPPAERGHAIQNYLRLVEGSLPAKMKRSFVIAGAQKEQLMANQIPIKLLGQGCLVTVFDHLMKGQLNESGTN